MEVTLKVRRYDSGNGPEASEQSYTIEIDEQDTLLDALVQIRDENDPTLGFRGSCRSGFCGDCTMTVHGKGAITCRTKVGKAAKKSEDGVIPIAPIKMAKVVKDLIYDDQHFHWDKIKATQPWVDIDSRISEHDSVMSNERVKELRLAMSCTQCGLCDQGCVVLAIDKTYLGPGALTKAFRTVHDPRDTRYRERLDLLSQKRGVWDCAHCFEATEHCPKGIEPTDRIFDIHDKVIKEDLGVGGAKRHYKSFAASVKAHGWLDEARLAIESEGIGNVKGILKLIPLAVKAALRGKRPMPYFLHKKRPGYKKIRSIFEKWEVKR